MKITLHSILIRELVDGFTDNEEKGVVGYHGRLNIRPPFQREFVYDLNKQQEVVQSILKQFPLNVMYWIKNSEGGYELLDGQQRTLSICSYRYGGFVIKQDGNPKFFSSLTREDQERFLNYPLQVYICEDSTAKEQIDWFRIINIAGEKLTDQELLNAVYTGPWVTSAKQRFSKTNCVAYQRGNKYMDGAPIRQAYLQTVISWMCDKDGIGTVEEYMAIHQFDENSDREWQYFQQVISWVETLFPEYRKIMKGLAWGKLYNHYHEGDYSASALEQEIVRLMRDKDVTKKKGIYEYVFSHDERCLSIRAFDDDMRNYAYELQKGICKHCGKHFAIDEMEADHIVPWSKGGHTTEENCQMLCRDCNRRKSDK